MKTKVSVKSTQMDFFDDWLVPSPLISVSDEERVRNADPARFKQLEQQTFLFGGPDLPPDKKAVKKKGNKKTPREKVIDPVVDPKVEVITGLNGIADVERVIYNRLVREAEESKNAAESTESKRFVLAHSLARRLNDTGEVTSRQLTSEANLAFGGTSAEGKYSSKDAYDALEVAFSIHLLSSESESVDFGSIDAATAAEKITDLTQRIQKLPTQTRRDSEMDEFQQFSTPPALSFAANWVANVTSDDVMGEPSAGTGDLALWSKLAGAEVVLNELSERRVELLRELFPGEKVYNENAEQYNNALPKEFKPSVIVTNPPFSSTAGRVQGQRKTANGARHIEQSLKRLENGGRLVGIVGNGMSENSPGFKKWWDEIKTQYNVRANIDISGNEYRKYGTTFDNQIIVIDKTGPTVAPVLTATVDSVAELPKLLEGIKNDRKAIKSIQQTSAQSAVSSNLGSEQNSLQSERGSSWANINTRSSGERTDRDAAAGARVVDSKTVGDARHSHVVNDGERARSADGIGVDASSKRGGSGAVRGDNRGTDSSDADRVVITGEEISKQSEFTDSIFANYSPQKLTINGSKPHPGLLVQSAAMAAVDPPTPTYSPTLPSDTINEGKLSIAQLETVVYAGQAHSEILPNGDRKGFFVGDGTGVGKGREISGVILDNLLQGRTKSVWVSFNEGLLVDAKRDFSGVGGNPDKIFFQGKTKAADEIAQKDGVLFTTYATLRSGQKKQSTDLGQEGGKTRAQQIKDWLGPDFDGVIAFDESHSMGNAVTTKGERGEKKASAQALAGIELQKALPKARIVYVSATGATEISNLSYADRLGLWGEGTPFADNKAFIDSVSRGGIASMELIARDMKAMGVYLARSLSYEGVSYERLEHNLTDLQKDIYDELAGAWSIVLDNVQASLKITGGEKNSSGKSAAYSQFWGAHQRFFNQIITAMKTPSVIDDIERQLEAGNAVVVQLVNTNEAAQKRLIADAAKDGKSLESLDFTPRQMLIDYVRNGFPVVAYEDVMGADGNVTAVVVRDSEGATVFDQDAIAMRDQLLETLENIRVPENPLDAIINRFGTDKVAEVTGRSTRYVQERDADGFIKVKEEKRGKGAAKADALDFQNDKKDILIFSGAGGTGYSFHADLDAKNQRKRIHYMLQPGWQAFAAVQGLGRSHRTNQASAPHYVLPATDLASEKRFISSIARKLAQLGALTKGQRDTGNQGIFSASDNLESEYAVIGLANFFKDLREDKTGLDFGEVTKKMGLNIIDEYGNYSEEKVPGIPQFLNRLLSLSFDLQNGVFEEFEKRLIEAVEYAQQQGTYDVGMETLKADKIVKIKDDVVYEDKLNGAKTRYVELEVTNSIKYTPWEIIQGKSEGNDSPKDTVSGWYVAEKKEGETEGSVFYMEDMGSRLSQDKMIQRAKIHLIRGDRAKYTDKAGAIAEGYEEKHVKGRLKVIPLAKKISEAEAKVLWLKQSAEAPQSETKIERMLVGAILPVWDRVAGKETIKRLQTEEGEQLLGRMLAPKDARETLKNLGVASVKLSVSQVVDAINKGDKAILSNGWTVSTSKVNFENRIELSPKGAEFTGSEMNVLKAQGAYSERINWRERMFVPTGDSSVDVLEKIFESKPVVDVIEKQVKNKKGGVVTDISSNYKEAPVEENVKPLDFDKSKELLDIVASDASFLLPKVILARAKNGLDSLPQDAKSMSLVINYAKKQDLPPKISQLVLAAEKEVIGLLSQKGVQSRGVKR